MKWVSVLPIATTYTTSPAQNTTPRGGGPQPLMKKLNTDMHAPSLVTTGPCIALCSLGFDTACSFAHQPARQHRSHSGPLLSKALSPIAMHGNDQRIETTNCETSHMRGGGVGVRVSTFVSQPPKKRERKKETSLAGAMVGMAIKVLKWVVVCPFSCVEGGEERVLGANTTFVGLHQQIACLGVGFFVFVFCV